MADEKRIKLVRHSGDVNENSLIYDRYKEGFAGLPISMNPYMECTEPNFWLSCLIIDKEVCDKKSFYLLLIFYI